MENITEKIQLFSKGFIKNNITDISYVISFRDNLYNVINDYWDDDTKYQYQFLTEEDLANVYPDVAVAVPSAFNINSYIFTSGDIETITGIDFAADYNLTGTLVDTLVAGINNANASLIASIIPAVSAFTGNIAISDRTVYSEGINNLIKVNMDYLDSVDVNTYYSNNLDIVLQASNINDISIKESILSSILNKSKIKSKRLNICNKNNLLYCKHADAIIQQICIDNLSSILTYQQCVNFAKALNSIMPSDITIENNHSNKDIITTAKALIDEIDLVKKAIKYKNNQ